MNCWMYFPRWRVLQSMTPLSSLKSMSRTFWLLADSNIQFLKPIAPFAKYDIRTELQYESATDKWFHFTHTFVHPEKSDVIYAVIKARMVLHLLCVYVCMYVNLRRFVSMYECMNLYCMYVCMRVYIYVYNKTLVCVCMYECIY